MEEMELLAEMLMTSMNV